MRPDIPQSDSDQKMFNPDWTLKPGWEVSVEREPVDPTFGSGWQYRFCRERTREVYWESDLRKRRSPFSHSGAQEYTVRGRDGFEEQAKTGKMEGFVKALLNAVPRD